MICYVMYNYSVYICIPARNLHYHAHQFNLYIMLPLNQNTIKFHNLNIHFYPYLSSIDKINFLNNYYTCSYLQSTHMILEDKTYSPVLSFVPILVII